MSVEAPVGKHSGWLATMVRSNWPYLVMLLLALVGVALSSASLSHMIVFWEALVPIFGVTCFAARGKSAENSSLLASVRNDGLHWLAVFVAMRLLMLPNLSQMLNADALSLMLLTVLALGTFTSAIRIGSWKIGVVGTLLALAVPALAWVERTVLLVGVIGVGILCALLFARSFRS